MRKEYPSSGDSGQSKLVTGQMVGKDHEMFDAVGTVDELNSVLGWVRCVCDDDSIREKIEWVQQRLLNFGGHISGWMKTEFDPKQVDRLEKEIHDWRQAVPDVREFILPNGTELSARFHIARTVCRRAERAVVRLKESQVTEISDGALKFINRLSDWLYMVSLWADARSGVQEVGWKIKGSGEDGEK